MFLSNRQNHKIDILEFRESYFPYIAIEIKEYFEQLKQDVSPDIIFTHYRKDLHQDHRFISELTWNTFRNHLILEYEIPKYDGDLGQPNLFVDLCENTANQKVNNIVECYSSQHEKTLV